MYNHYYVNKTTTGDPDYIHVIHTSDCRLLDSAGKRIYLGYFASYEEAVKKAKAIYKNVGCCTNCCIEVRNDMAMNA